MNRLRPNPSVGRPRGAEATTQEPQLESSRLADARAKSWRCTAKGVRRRTRRRRRRSGAGAAFSPPSPNARRTRHQTEPNPDECIPRNPETETKTSHSPPPSTTAARRLSSRSPCPCARPSRISIPFATPSWTRLSRAGWRLSWRVTTRSSGRPRRLAATRGSFSWRSLGTTGLTGPSRRTRARSSRRARVRCLDPAGRV